MIRTAILGVALIATAGAAQAAVYTISDRGSFATVDTNSIGGSRPGMNRWEVGGTNHLYSQWFWFRTADMDREERINALPEIGSFTSNTNIDPAPDVLNILYGNAQLSIEIKFSIHGGTEGSDIGEQIRIINRSRTESLRMSFFQYSDFDLGNDVLDDYCEIVNPNIARQADLGSGIVLNETVVTPPAQNWEVSTFPTTIGLLDNGVVNNLNGNAGPGVGRADYTWAFQWNIEIAPGGSFMISKDKNIIVPAPGAIALLGVAGLIAGRRRRA